MTNEQFILLDQHGNGTPFFMPDQLRGQTFYREGYTGYADSVKAVHAAGLHRAPLFLILGGRSKITIEKPKQFSEGNTLFESEWTTWYDGNHERLTLKDTHGTYGPMNNLVVVDIVNAPFFSDDHERIRAAVKDATLVSGALKFNRNNKKECTALERLLYEGVVGEKTLGDHFYQSYNAFREASALFVNPDGSFVDGNLSFAVIRPAAMARKLSPSGYRTSVIQRTNPELIIAAAGVRPANALLDRAETFHYTEFGVWNDGYVIADSGRTVLADNLGDGGVDGGRSLADDGRSVGVAPETLAMFYKNYREDTLEQRVR